MVAGSAAEARAWGRLGHEIICEVAYARVSEATRLELDRLVALDPDFERFPESCAWADSPRKRATEHYVNLPRDARHVAEVVSELQSDHILRAIEKDRAALVRGGVSDERRLELVKFLAHFVGDIHQPMHVSFADDRGANDIRVLGECSGTLHGAWDGCILEKTLGTDARIVAQNLGGPRVAGDRTRWAQESFSIARDPQWLYCVRRGARCDYSEEQGTYERGAPKRKVQLDSDYLQRAAPVIRSRLWRAGLRLARVLDRSVLSAAE